MSGKDFFRKAENALAAMIVLPLALFPTMEVVARKFFKTGIANSSFIPSISFFYWHSSPP